VSVTRKTNANRNARLSIGDGNLVELL